MRSLLVLLCVVLVTGVVAGPTGAADAAEGAGAARPTVAAERADARAEARAIRERLHREARHGSVRAGAATTPRRATADTPSTLVTVTDPTAEAGVLDSRGDIVSSTLDHRRGDVLRLGLQTRDFEDPLAPNWRTGLTWLSWSLDTDDDGVEDVDVLAVNHGGRRAAWVLRADTGDELCTGEFSASAAAGYVVSLPASCVGDPARLRHYAMVGYDHTPDDPDDDVSLDFAPDDDWWAPTATRGPSPHLHAKPAGRRGTTFYLRDDLRAGYTDLRLDLGLASDIGLLCDWDGDGDRTLGVFRAGRWSVRNANDAGDPVTWDFGLPGDVPVCGDWDGTATEKPGVYRDGIWYLHRKGHAPTTFQHGLPGDTPVVGDWDGDGVTTVGVVRGVRWYLRDANTGGVSSHVFDYGLPGDAFVPGDWDGDGRDTPGVFRAGEWLVRNDLTSGLVAWTWIYGDATIVPLVWR